MKSPKTFKFICFSLRSDRNTFTIRQSYSLVADYFVNYIVEISDILDTGAGWWADFSKEVSAEDHSIGKLQVFRAGSSGRLYSKQRGIQFKILMLHDWWRRSLIWKRSKFGPSFWIENILKGETPGSSSSYLFSSTVIPLKNAKQKWNLSWIQGQLTTQFINGRSGETK